MINGIDAEIVKMLQKNARISNAEIARTVGLAPSAVFERIRKLEEKGIVRGYHADVDPRAVELGQLAFMFIRSNDRPGAVGTAAQLSEVPEILELHHVAGEDCFLAKVRARDAEALGRLLRDRLSRIESITSTRTTIVLEVVKESVELPIGACEQEDEEAASA
jgi:Lrp/AsnC family transcriptional regulator, leucine-responsive regulatory protein